MMWDWIKGVATAFLVAVAMAGVGWFFGLGFAAAVKEKMVIVVMNQPDDLEGGE